MIYDSEPIYNDTIFLILFDDKRHKLLVTDNKDYSEVINLLDKNHYFSSNLHDNIIQFIQIFQNNVTSKCLYCEDLFKKNKTNYCNSICKRKHNVILRKDQSIKLKEEIEGIKSQINKCEYCKVKFKLSSEKCGDHIIPLKEEKHNHIDNIAIVCNSCNSSKSNKDLLFWADKKDLNLPIHIIRHHAFLINKFK